MNAATAVRFAAFSASASAIATAAVGSTGDLAAQEREQGRLYACMEGNE